MEFLKNSQEISTMKLQKKIVKWTLRPELTETTVNPLYPINLGRFDATSPFNHFVSPLASAEGSINLTLPRWLSVLFYHILNEKTEKVSARIAHYFSYWRVHYWLKCPAQFTNDGLWRTKLCGLRSWIWCITEGSFFSSPRQREYSAPLTTNRHVMSDVNNLLFT